MQQVTHLSLAVSPLSYNLVLEQQQEVVEEHLEALVQEHLCMGMQLPWQRLLKKQNK